MMRNHYVAISNQRLTVLLLCLQVNDASCRHSTKERVVFRKLNGKYQFDTFPAGRGYILLLRCMTDA